MNSNTAFDNLRNIINTHFDKLNELINKKPVNIIVVGGYDYNNVAYHKKQVDKDNIETWNNPNECKYSDMVKLKDLLKEKGYEISISAVDSEYPTTKDNIDIPHYKEYYELNNTKYLKKEAINIVLIFTSLLPNWNWPLHSKQDNEADERFEFFSKLDKVKNYDIRYLYYFNSKYKGFPNNVIMNILQYDLKTPIYPYKEESYTYMIETIKLLNYHNIFEVMKPYVYGCFSFLGTPMMKGNKNSTMMRNVVKIVVETITDETIKNDFKLFINEEKKYNDLHKNTRLALCKALYGIDNCDSDGFN
jgi:hypothetical protein